MTADVEAVARAWMTHQGYTTEQIDQAEIQSHADAGCAYDGHGHWDCWHEDGASRHPVWDALETACEMANVAIEALRSSSDATHAVEVRTVDTVEQLDALPAGVVIRTEEGRIARRLADGWWEEIVSADELDDLPAQIIYHPEADR